MQDPDVSIVIVSFNTRDVLRECLESVGRESAGLRVEVLIVDNNSSDGSPEMIEREFPAVRLFRSKKPIIGAIHGPAVGGGLGLALVPDFRVACPEARFCANFTRLGFHPGFGLTVTLPALIGPSKAALMFYTSRRLGGEEAFAMGLADVLVPQAQVRSAALALAAEIAENGPLGLIATRATVRGDIADGEVMNANPPDPADPNSRMLFVQTETGWYNLDWIVYLSHDANGQLAATERQPHKLVLDAHGRAIVIDIDGVLDQLMQPVDEPPEP